MRENILFSVEVLIVRNFSGEQNIKIEERRKMRRGYRILGIGVVIWGGLFAASLLVPWAIWLRWVLGYFVSVWILALLLFPLMYRIRKEREAIEREKTTSSR